MTKLYNKVKRFVEESFEKCGFKKQIKHLKRTVYWIKRLKPDADEALLIAAISHDIGTAYKWEEMQKATKKEGFISKKRIKKHQEESSKIIGEFLKKHNMNSKTIARVKMLVSRHEEGGNKDQNLLKDADSISFLENNVDIFLKRVKDVGKEKVRQKFNLMYNRITLKKAKKIARPWYKKAMSDLEKIK
jgi:hypothetical protein